MSAKPSHNDEQKERLVRVLIADDRPRSRKGLKALLSTCPQLEVVGEAADGEAAVHLAAACQPDVALLDVRMPGLDGLQATRLVKNRCPSVRVIILTMYPDYRRQAHDCGADAFLVKGCPPELLIETILKRK